MTENVKKREECIGENLPAGFIERNGLIDPTTVDEEDEEPVAPAPTASADNEALKLAQSRAHFDVAAMTGAEVLAEKLAGVGQQAAARIVDDFLRGEPHEYQHVAFKDIAAIIDELIAGRVKP